MVNIARTMSPPQKPRRPVSPNDRAAVMPGNLALPVPQHIATACDQWLARPLPMRPPVGVRR